MKTKPIIVITAAAALILVVLIAAFLFLRKNRFPLTNPPETTLQNRVYPTDGISRGGTTRIKSALRKAIKLSPTEKARIDTFTTRLPYYENGFGIEFDRELGVILVSAGTDRARESVKQYLQNQNVLDIYLKGSPIFIVSTKPIETLKKDIRDERIYEFEEMNNEVQDDSWKQNVYMRTNTYYVQYDKSKNAIVAELYGDRGQEFGIKAEIKRRLLIRNVPLNLYPVTYITRP